jgi:hypothetical protein
MLACTNVNLRAADQGDDKSRYSVNEENRIKTGGEQSEQQVIYHDMIEAYQKGQFSEARKLARAHLQHFSDEMNTVSDERERESAVHASLDIISQMFGEEDKLPATERFGRDTDLLQDAEDRMIEARDVFSRLKPHDKNREFIQDKIRQNSERWLRAGKTIVSRGRLESHYRTFKQELEGAGYSSVDNVLNVVKPRVQQSQEPQPVSDEDRGKILKLIDGFYRGMISGDKQLIAAVTGSNKVKASALLDRYNSDLRSKGISKIIKATLPEMSAENYTVQRSNVSPNIYSVSVQGIKIDVIQADGSQSTSTGDKLFSLKKEMSGAWTLELPERK